MRASCISAAIGLVLTSCATQSPTTPVVKAGFLIKSYRDSNLFASNHTYTYLVTGDGKSETEWSTPANMVDEPQWSPDGNWIVFSTLYGSSHYPGRNHESEIRLVASDGSKETLLADGSYDASSPRWSPDGLHVAFYSHGSDSIHVVEVGCIVQGEDCMPKPRLLIQGYSPDWSPDGARILYSTINGIFAIGKDGMQQPIQITSSIGGGRCGGVEWSPDGLFIAALCGDIYVMNADGTSPRFLVKGRNFTWSPDGMRIAYVADVSGSKIGGWDLFGGDAIYPQALFTVKVDGSDIVRVTSHDREHVIWYTWLPTTGAKSGH